MPKYEVLHFDCASGIAGDMFLGACLELGLPLDVLEEAVEQLGLDGVSIRAERSKRCGITGTRFVVLEGGNPVEERVGLSHSHGAHSHHRGHRSYADIRALIDRSALASDVKDLAQSLFRELAEVEAHVHGETVEDVHFHEVGAVDSIVDLVGAAAAYCAFAPELVTCGPVATGGGSTMTQHGRVPIPAPATALLLRGVPVESGVTEHGELTTPTGALLLSQFVDEFDGIPPMRIDDVGYGLGHKELPNAANAFRLLAGQRVGRSAGAEVTVIECEVDDLSGEGLGFLMERLFEEGALDVFFTPVQMKKSRPGVLVTLLARPDQAERIAATLLLESGSLGCRFRRQRRLEAERETTTVPTPFGEIDVKRAQVSGEWLPPAPEFDDCRRAAKEHGVPWRRVYDAAIQAALEVTR